MANKCLDKYANKVQLWTWTMDFKCFSAKFNQQEKSLKCDKAKGTNVIK